MLDTKSFIDKKLIHRCDESETITRHMQEKSIKNIIQYSMLDTNNFSLYSSFRKNHDKVQEKSLNISMLLQYIGSNDYWISMIVGLSLPTMTFGLLPK